MYLCKLFFIVVEATLFLFDFKVRWLKMEKQNLIIRYQPRRDLFKNLLLQVHSNLALAQLAINLVACISSC